MPTTDAIGANVILRALTGRNGLVPVSRYTCCPRVSWGLLNHEADLIAMSDAGYVTEVEIKISHSDLKRDIAKRKWMVPQTSMVKFFYYAMPARVYELAEAAGTLARLPAHAGLVTIDRKVHRPGEPGEYRTTLTVVKKIATANGGARPLRDGERIQLLRLIAFRYWDLVTAGKDA